MLLLYGSQQADFDDFILKANDEGEMIEEKEKKIAKLNEELSKKQQQLIELETMRNAIRNGQ